jgi:uncharacterized protein (DUF1501 family)
MLTRRDFLRWGLGASPLLACGSTVPLFLARSASVLAAGRANKDNILIVVQLDGGNDGLNTVIPYRDDDYRKHRPRINLAADQRLHQIDDRIALHPSLIGFAKLFEGNRLALVQSVGYPNPNRSHFESMAVWHTASLKPDASTPGWLARSLERRPAAAGGDTPGMHISDRALPQALYGGQRYVPTLASLEQFRRRLGVVETASAREQRLALDQIGAQDRGEPGSLLQFIERSTLITYASSARLEEAVKGSTAMTGYPEFYGLAQRLRLIAQLIKAGLTTSIYYTQLDGFDTHANQLNSHGFLLQQLGQSLKAFLDDMQKSGEAERVLVLVFSEFGRRLHENASGGTDHGTAAPVFLLGPVVKAGVHGPYPNLQDLDAGGDPKFAIDFRQVYAAVLDDWLRCPSMPVLGGKFPSLTVLHKQAG